MMAESFWILLLCTVSEQDVDGWKRNSICHISIPIWGCVSMSRRKLEPSGGLFGDKNPMRLWTIEVESATFQRSSVMAQAAQVSRPLTQAGSFT